MLASEKIQIIRDTKHDIMASVTKAFKVLDGLERALMDEDRAQVEKERNSEKKQPLSHV